MGLKGVFGIRDSTDCNLFLLFCGWFGEESDREEGHTVPRSVLMLGLRLSSGK